MVSGPSATGYYTSGVPCSPTLKTTHKAHDCPRVGRGNLSLDTHLLAMCPNLLQILHLGVFPPAPDFSLMEISPRPAIACTANNGLVPLIV